MSVYLDDLIAKKSLYLLMQTPDEKILEKLKKEAQERCKKFIGYPMVQANEKKDETSLAPITEEIFLLKKIKNMLGHIRMLFYKECSEGSLCTTEKTQQETMEKILLDRYETTMFSSKQIEKILGRETIMNMLGIDFDEFVKQDKYYKKNHNRKIEIER